MTRILLVRHGQASATGADYDALSDIGHRQAALLGHSWQLRGWQFEQVMVGPRKRHRETETAVANLYRAEDQHWPEAEQLDTLDEHHGPQVARWLQGRQQHLDEPLALKDPDQTEDIDQILRAYMNFMEDWITAAHESGPFESWAEFRHRSGELLDTLESVDQDTAAFTSGGVIAGVVGALLELDDSEVLELSYSIGNCAWTELRRGHRGLQLAALNQQPDFPSPDLYTRV